MQIYHVPQNLRNTSEYGQCGHYPLLKIHLFDSFPLYTLTQTYKT